MQQENWQKAMEGIFLHDQMKSVAAYQEEKHPKQSEIDCKQVDVQA